VIWLWPSRCGSGGHCRCFGSQRLSNGKREGRGSAKNGNKYLAWAYLDAAKFAVPYNAGIKRYYQRKRAKSNGAWHGPVTTSCGRVPTSTSPVPSPELGRVVAVTPRKGLAPESAELSAALPPPPCATEERMLTTRLC
jgi:hypothetical protein